LMNVLCAEYQFALYPTFLMPILYYIILHDFKLFWYVRNISVWLCVKHKYT